MNELTILDERVVLEKEFKVYGTKENPLFLAKDVAEWIETITNGSMLNPKLNQELVDSGIDRIRISIEAIDAVGYKNIANVNIDVKILVENIADLYKRSRGKTEIYIKTVDASVDTESKKELFYTMFGDICDKIFIDNVK